MKSIFTLVIAILFSTNLFSQTPGWQWAIGAGTAGVDESGNSITADAAGNIYSIGEFSSSTLTIGSASLTRAGGGNPYIVKQDANGNVIWAKNYSFSPPTLFGYGSGKSIYADAAGNVYIAGYYMTSIVIGTTTLVAQDSSSTNVGDIFIAKLDASGNVLWAKSAGGAVADAVNGITADAAGNVYITGLYRSRYFRFGNNITLFNPAASSANFFVNTDIYVAKYDASGTPQWAKNTQAAGGGFNEGKSICVDAAGNVLVAGTFYLPSIAFGTNTLTGTAAVNLFVTKYDNAGNVTWAKTATAAGSGAINHTANGVTTDASNNVYFTGSSIASTLTMGSSSIVNSGCIIGKLDPTGTALWLKAAGRGSAIGTGISKDNSGNVYATGYFDGMNCIFGTDTIKNKNTGGNNEDIFVTKYSTSGSAMWAVGAGGIFRDISNGITVDGNGNAIITGLNKNTALTFGTLSLTCTGSYNDIFIAKMGTPTGIKENSVYANISIYPNPSSGIINIKQNELGEAELKTILITDVLGKVVYMTEITSTQTEINLSNQPKGIYFIRAEDKNKKMFTGKIILE